MMVPVGKFDSMGQIRRSTGIICLLVGVLTLTLRVLPAGIPLASASAAEPSLTKTLQFIQTDDQGIIIRVRNTALGEVLNAIESRTGIHFRVAPELLQDIVTTKLNVPDWKTGVEKLLDNYNWVGLWSSRFESTQIHILARKEYAAGTLSLEKPMPVAPQPAAASSSGLTQKQLQELAKGPFRSPLPPHLFHDPSYKPFLKQYGIASLQDMKDTRKAMRVRVKARKRLQQIQEDILKGQ